MRSKHVVVCLVKGVSDQIDVILLSTFFVVIDW